MMQAIPGLSIADSIAKANAAAEKFRHEHHLAQQQSGNLAQPRPAPAGEIALVLEVLRGQLDVLHKVTFALQESLSPVLRCEPNGDCGTACQSYQTPLGGMLGDFSANLGQAVARIASMQALIEL